MKSADITNKSEKTKKTISHLSQKLDELKKEINFLYQEINNNKKPLQKKLKKQETLLKKFKSRTDVYNSRPTWWQTLIMLFLLSIVLMLILGDFFKKIEESNLLYYSTILILLSISYWLVKKIKYFFRKMKNGGKQILTNDDYYKKLESLEREIEKTNKNLEKISNNHEIDKLNIEFKKVEKEYSFNKNMIHTLERTNKFVTVYDKDDNGKLDIAETTNIDKLLSKHQNNIREIEKEENKSFIPDLVKINIFLNDYQKNLVNEFRTLASGKGITNKIINRPDIITFNKNLNLYKTLISSLVLMIDSIVNDNHILYFKLKDSMDKYGVFETNFQKKQIDLLEENNKVTSQLIKETSRSRNQIVNQILGVNKSLSNIDNSIQLVGDEIWSLHKSFNR